MKTNYIAMQKYLRPAVTCFMGVGFLIKAIHSTTPPAALSLRKSLTAKTMDGQTISISNIDGSLTLVHCQGNNSCDFFSLYFLLIKWQSLPALLEKHAYISMSDI